MKNSEVKTSLANFKLLKGLMLPGDINYEISVFKSALNKQEEVVIQAEKDLLESMCLKKEDGKPDLTETINNGRKELAYQFKDEDISKVSEEIQKINDIEFSLPEGKIALERILAITSTPEQYDALILLAKK